MQGIWHAGQGRGRRMCVRVCSCKCNAENDTKAGLGMLHYFNTAGVSSVGCDALSRLAQALTELELVST